MRLVILVAAAALATAVIVLVIYGSRPRGPRASRWEVRTESGGGRTVVAVVQAALEDGAELGRQHIAEIPDAAPDWEARYEEAMSRARDRVSLLRVQAEPVQPDP
ncbi:hypothetical protein [Actinomadura atramentaria]|uniref:hypothetical protein n=1 Tax=Actinomadura atramentaria TaxID=1990 RepID=UPI00037D60B1|nr:hypothetical protein [Actinomadura atramentaria]